MHPGTAIQLSQDEMLLLAEQIPNEVCNGFRIENFEACIGCGQREFIKLALELRSRLQAQVYSMNVTEAQLLHNALRATLCELGEEEFFTRTGFEFVAGTLLLKKLDDFLNQPR